MGSQSPLLSAAAQHAEQSTACRMLANHLALETAPVLAGIKPSCLVNMTSRQRPDGISLCSAWHTHGVEVLQDSQLHAQILLNRGDSLLLLIYRPETLTAHLQQRGVNALLSRAGYARPDDLHSVLQELSTRFTTGEFPHEIGLLLGYPLKDVAGFLGWSRLPCTGSAPWRMYGNPLESRTLANRYQDCRRTMAARLRRGDDPGHCLRSASTATHTTLRTPNS